MKQLLFANPDLCTGCNRCAYVCSAVKENVFRPKRARIHINTYPVEGYSVPSVCFQCPGASCMKACPVDAIYRNDADVVVVNEEACTECGACVDACPYGMIELDDKGIAYKCDTCDGDPACVKECEPGALSFVEQTPELVKMKGQQMKQRSSDCLSHEKRDNLGKAILEQHVAKFK